MRIQPFQLFPELDAPGSGSESQYLYERNPAGSDARRASEEQLQSLASDLGLPPLRLTDGAAGGTFHAHRLIQHFQAARGEEAARRLADALFRKHLCEGRMPAADDVLAEACAEAGIDAGEAAAAVRDKGMGAERCRREIRAAGADVEVVPVVVVEGRRRDLTLRGAREVGQYVAALETVVKEST